MPRPDETAYPYLKRSPGERELNEVFTPTLEDIALAEQTAPRSHTSRLGFVVLLKTCQWLGYFVQLDDVPRVIVEHVARALGFLIVPADLASYDRTGGRVRHMNVIRARLGLHPFDDTAAHLLAASVREAAHMREDLRDIISYAVETLSKRRYELPGFSTIQRAARSGRAEVNGQLCHTVYAALGEAGCAQLDRLWSEPGRETNTTLWNDVKQDPGPPTLKEVRAFIHHSRWLADLRPIIALASLLPDAKVRQFAAEASTLDAGSMKRLTPARRYTLGTALLEVQAGTAADALGTMLVRRMGKVHQRSREALKVYQAQQQERTTRLVRTLREVAAAYGTDGDQAQRFEAIADVLGDGAETIIAQCDAYEASVTNNVLPFVWKQYQSSRSSLFAILQHVEFRSTTSDKGLEQARQFVLDHEHKRGAWLALPAAGLDLSWVPDGWWPLIRDKQAPDRLNRKQFEACLFSQLMLELKNGDTYIR